ncbi:hypothetical protein TSUD_369850 [Trifolium subterraneum]|uniref:Tubulin/FtsZ GTPase domain-containing protein n=1 Tax=Trifolium subterraneum TaxID=3900 RepID=A0A1B5Z957_TRISU|nr:hypothetical protein TSUD_369850 [Trifolium subterraneum]
MHSILSSAKPVPTNTLLVQFSSIWNQPSSTKLGLVPTVNFYTRNNSIIFGKEDAANNFARGHYTVGKEIVDLCFDLTLILCSCVSGNLYKFKFESVFPILSDTLFDDFDEFDNERELENMFLVPDDDFNGNFVDTLNQSLNLDSTDWNSYCF